MKFKIDTENVKSDIWRKALENWNKLPLFKRIKITINNEIWFFMKNPKHYFKVIFINKE